MPVARYPFVPARQRLSVPDEHYLPVPEGRQLFVVAASQRRVGSACIQFENHLFYCRGQINRFPPVISSHFHGVSPGKSLRILPFHWFQTAQVCGLRALNRCDNRVGRFRSQISRKIRKCCVPENTKSQSVIESGLFYPLSHSFFPIPISFKSRFSPSG